jgi:hypothetical protein
MEVIAQVRIRFGETSDIVAQLAKLIAFGTFLAESIS